jgi:hypothetical protein
MCRNRAIGDQVVKQGVMSEKSLQQKKLEGCGLGEGWFVKVGEPLVHNDDGKPRQIGPEESNSVSRARLLISSEPRIKSK